LKELENEMNVLNNVELRQSTGGGIPVTPIDQWVSGINAQMNEIANYPGYYAEAAFKSA